MGDNNPKDLNAPDSVDAESSENIDKKSLEEMNDHVSVGSYSKYM